MQFVCFLDTLIKPHLVQQELIRKKAKARFKSSDGNSWQFSPDRYSNISNLPHNATFKKNVHGKVCHHRVFLFSDQAFVPLFNIYCFPPTFKLKAKTKQNKTFWSLLKQITTSTIPFLRFVWKLNSIHKSSQDAEPCSVFVLCIISDLSTAFSSSDWCNLIPPLIWTHGLLGSSGILSWPNIWNNSFNYYTIFPGKERSYSSPNIKKHQLFSSNLSFIESCII